MSKPKVIYKIHPALGFARLGDANDYFIGPEFPGVPPSGKSGKFKTGSNDKILPQAARFRVFKYELKGGHYKPTGIVTPGSGGVAAIEWTVHVANVKASFHRFNELAGDGTGHPAAARRNASTTNRADRLDIDPGPRTISGKNKSGSAFHFAPQNPSKEHWAKGAGTGIPTGKPAVIDYLGELRTDADGNLIVIGGRGISKSPSGLSLSPDYANNPDWFDDVSDGPVTAKVKLDNGSKAPDVVGAWVIVGPPDYAPALKNAVSLYDLLFDMAVRLLPIPKDNGLYATGGPLEKVALMNQALYVQKKKTLNGVYKPSFDEDIYPILKGAVDVHWCFAPAQIHHNLPGTSFSLKDLIDPSSNMGFRTLIYQRLRVPAGFSASGAGRNMPKLLDDEMNPKLSLTPTQFLMLQEWAAGRFKKGTAFPPAPAASTTPTPHGLDQAAMENCVGGAFCPGIEVGWQIRHLSLYATEPFRVDPATAKSGYYGESGLIKPGHFSRQMALPWQSDFFDCAAQGPYGYAWWPAQRPINVFPSAADARNRKKTGMTMASWARQVAGRDKFVKDWNRMGFVVRDATGDVYYEDERATSGSW